MSRASERARGTKNGKRPDARESISNSDCWSRMASSSAWLASQSGCINARCMMGAALMMQPLDIHSLTGHITGTHWSHNDHELGTRHHWPHSSHKCSGKCGSFASPPIDPQLAPNFRTKQCIRLANYWRSASLFTRSPPASHCQQQHLSPHTEFVPDTVGVHHCVCADSINSQCQCIDILGRAQ